MKKCKKPRKETPDEKIVRLANELIKAVLVSGRTIHSTPGVSSIDIAFYKVLPEEIHVENIISGWTVRGKSQVEVSFASIPEDINDVK